MSKPGECRWRTSRAADPAPTDPRIPKKQDLEAFLCALTARNVPDIVADAFAAPIGDLNSEDPNWANENTLGY